MQQRAAEWFAGTPARLRSLISTVRARSTGGAARVAETVRHLERVNFDGRGRTALVASVALVGTGLAGAVATSVYSAVHDGPGTAQVATVDAGRALTDRADRGTRPTDIPAPLADPAAPAPAAPAAPAPAAPAPAAAAPAPAPAPKPGWVAPFDTYRLSSCFGPRWGKNHQGLDFAVGMNTPIHSAAAGTVISAGFKPDGYGISIIIGDGHGTYELYGHTNKALVTVGQHVETGQVIGLVGSTGHSTGPHLHFEVWSGKLHRIDPVPFLRARGVTLNGC